MRAHVAYARHNTHTHAHAHARTRTRTMRTCTLLGQRAQMYDAAAKTYKTFGLPEWETIVQGRAKL